MTFDQLTVFHTIIQCGSFKSAASKLHKTQPAISFAIKKLEDELGVNLFDRSQYRPQLTAYGKIFFERSHKLIQGMAELENLSNSFRQLEEPEITISVDGIALHTEMLRLFRTFNVKNPNTKLHLNFDILSEAERKIQTGDADIGITHFISEKKTLEIVPLTYVKMVPVINTELFKEKKIKGQNQLLDIDQIVVADKNAEKGVSFGLLENGKKWRLFDSNFKKEIILAGLGWGHLSEQSIERELKEKKLTVLNFKDIHPKTLEIYLIRLKQKPLGVVGKRLWEELISFHQ
jgi:DNA-binding transcriptional LysR family regulator